ncbi:MAG: ATP-binding protein [Clostridiales bacterium]|nr:ATP-binding protein [Clostridiales bacterium]
MALTNSQFQAVMRGYEERQLKGRHEQEERQREVYARIPQMEALDREIGIRSAACARRVLDGDTAARDQLREDMAQIRRQKADLMRQAGFPEDYLKVHYSCPDCKDTGYVEGKRCRCFERERIRILYAQSNIQEILERENFDTFSFSWYDDRERIPGLGVTELAYMRRVERRLREFVRDFPDGGQNILFTGSTGVGKTFLSNCVARALMDRGISVICLSSDGLFELLSRSRFGREGQEEAEEAGEYILDCDMLILDDLGTELNNTFVSSQLFHVINERIGRRRGTIISTNLSMDLLRDAYSDRVTSRLMSCYMTIPLYGADIRMKKRSAAHASAG